MSLKDSYCRKQTITIGTTPGGSTEIPYHDAESGVVYLDAGIATISLSWYVANEQGGTFYPLYSAANAVVTPTTVAHTRAYPFPPDARGAASVKIVGDAAGTGTVSIKTS